MQSSHYNPLAVAFSPSLIWFCLGCACVIVVSVTKPTFLEVDPRRPCSSSANPIRALSRVQMNRRVIEIFHHVVSPSSVISIRLLCCGRETFLPGQPARSDIPNMQERENEIKSLMIRVPICISLFTTTLIVHVARICYYSCGSRSYLANATRNQVPSNIQTDQDFGHNQRPATSSRSTAAPSVSSGPDL